MLWEGDDPPSSCKLLFYLTTVSNENSSQVALEDVMPWKYGGAFLAACSWGTQWGENGVLMMDPCMEYIYHGASKT